MLKKFILYVIRKFIRTHDEIKNKEKLKTDEKFIQKKKR
jgi:hypothetical protein